MVEVCWREAVEFCNAASRRSALMPAYTVEVFEIDLPGGWAPHDRPVPDDWSVTWDDSADGQRLPTESGVAARLPRRNLYAPLRPPRGHRLVRQQPRAATSRGRREGTERLGALRHPRRCVGVVSGLVRPGRLRLLSGHPRRRLGGPGVELSGRGSPHNPTHGTARRPRLPAGPIGSAWALCPNQAALRTTRPTSQKWL